MKNSDQLRFTFQDVIPVQPRKENNATQPAANQKVPTNDPNKNYNPKEARLIFYSNLASHEGPTVRISRRLNKNIAPVTRPATSNDFTDIPDNYMKNLDFELSGNKDNEQPFTDWLKNTVGNLKDSFSKTFETMRSYELPKFKSNLSFAVSKKVLLILVAFLLFIAVLGFGIKKSNDDARKKAQAENQAQAEWEQTKKQWECTLARYEAKQNKAPLSADKEKLCANIN